MQGQLIEDMDIPLLSVILPVYNGERYLREALDSILNQTYSDFEIIVIDDGSTDGTSSILSEYQQIDSRIQVHSQENQRLIASLNTGCKLAKGKYLARMDADDISHPDRFRKQVNYLDTHNDVGVVGTWSEIVNEEGKFTKRWYPPTDPDVVGWNLMFGCCIAHPSVMMRKEVVERAGYYRAKALHVEDYDLWTRANAIAKIANLSETLFWRRACKDSVSSLNSDIQLQNEIPIVQRNITELLQSSIDKEKAAELISLHRRKPPEDLDQIQALALLLMRIYEAYTIAHSLRSRQAREVSYDVSTKFCILAWSAYRKSVSEALALLLKAFRLCPITLPWRMLTRGMNRVVRRLRC